MTSGVVLSLTATLPVTLCLPGRDETIQVVVDTGFTGALALPLSLVRSLSLPYAFSDPVELADESSVEVPVYEATLLWQGYEVEVAVIGTGSRPLLGTALLAGWEFQAQFIEAGSVMVREIEPAPVGS